jgi:LDH2 family malate/lactate/ureidoglycolate dehydrogenase
VAEILGGLLTGNGLGREWWNRGGPAINGLFFQAIQIEEFQPMGEFLAKLDELVEFARSRQPAPGFGPIRLPGERSRANAERQMRDGVTIEETAWAELVRCAAELGIQDIPKPLGEGR